MGSPKRTNLRKKNRFVGRRGFALIAVYLLIAVLITFTGSLAAHTMSDVRAAHRESVSVQTMYLAEAGMDQAIAWLRNPDALAQVSAAGPEPEIPYTALGVGGYEVDIEPVAGQPELYRLLSTGYAVGQDPALTGYQERRLETFVQVQGGFDYPNGLFGVEEVDLNGSVRVDSYDSGAQSFLPTQLGRIGSNGTESETIEVVGAVQVFGDILAGPGAEPDAIQIDGSSWVSGQVGAAEEEVAVPAVTESAGTEDLIVTDSDEVYPGGTYRWNELKIGGAGSVSFTGPAVVYVRELKVSGTGLFAADNLPGNLVIQVVGDGDVKLKGNSGFYGVIYAPESQVKLSGSNRLFGSVTGREIKGDGSIELWYDEALEQGGVAGSAAQVTVRTWQEVR